MKGRPRSGKWLRLIIHLQVYRNLPSPSTKVVDSSKSLIVTGFLRVDIAYDDDDQSEPVTVTSIHLSTCQRCCWMAACWHSLMGSRGTPLNIQRHVVFIILSERLQDTGGNNCWHGSDIRYQMKIPTSIRSSLNLFSAVLSGTRPDDLFSCPQTVRLTNVLKQLFCSFRWCKWESPRLADSEKDTITSKFNGTCTWFFSAKDRGIVTLSVRVLYLTVGKILQFLKNSH